MNMLADIDEPFLVKTKEQALIHRSKDLHNYVGDIDMDGMLEFYEQSFERFVTQNGEKIDFEDFINQAENLVTIVMTAHPTFFKSKEEAGLLSKLFTARATHNDEQVEILEAQIKTIQAKHPYLDPTTDEEGERLYDALENTIAAGHMMQRAMLNVAKKNYPTEYKNGRYSPFARALWQKFDRDGRDIPVNIQLSESLRQRRMGLELVYLPQFKSLLEKDLTEGQRTSIKEAIEQIQLTANIYHEKENQLAQLDENNVDMIALQGIIDELDSTKEKRITHPVTLTSALKPFLQDANVSDDLFETAKLINDDLRANGLCFATPTHRVNAQDVHHYLEVEQRKLGHGDLRHPDQVQADDAHFSSTEQMIADATDQVSGTFTEVLEKAPKDGKPIHEMLMIRRFIHDAIDEHTIEKIDIAEAHNAMTQRGLRFATKQYGVSEITDVGLLHEDHIGIDNAKSMYDLLLKSDQYLEEISHTVPGTNKKRPRLVMKIGYSDFAKQHSAPGGKPFNEKCLLQTMKAIKENNLEGKIDLDIEFAGGEGPGRRVNPKGYAWTLKETVTPAVLSYANKHGITLKYRETIQGGDGCILLGTEESASQVMATQLNHLSHYSTAPYQDTAHKQYFTDLSSNIREHHRNARDTYSELYKNPDFALLLKLHKSMCEKGGSRKLVRSEGKNLYQKAPKETEPLADFRAIGFNAANIDTGVHLPPIFGQGSVCYESLERTGKLVQSELFRERMMTAFMVRDLHVMDELKGFIELYNPEYWKKFDRFDADGNITTEAQIAKRLDSLVYSDGDENRIYARLKGVVRIIEDDLSDFDKMRDRFDFDDIEAIINKGDYAERVAEKRELIQGLHQSRLALMHDEFIRREEMPMHSPHYGREDRSNAIRAGAMGDIAVVSRAFDHAQAANDEPTFASVHNEIKEHFIPLLDLCYNA